MVSRALVVFSSVSIRYQKLSVARARFAGIATAWVRVSVPLSYPPSHAYPLPAWAVEPVVMIGRFAVELSSQEAVPDSNPPLVTTLTPVPGCTGWVMVKVRPATITVPVRVALPSFGSTV